MPDQPIVGPRRRTLQQDRAASAWANIKTVRGNKDHPPSEAAEKYGALVRGLPAQIQKDGLAVTLVFLWAKDEEHHRNAYRHISHWVMQQLVGQNSSQDLLDWVLDKEQKTTDYRRAANEALAYVTWLKRFAEAEGLKDDSTGS